MLKKIVSQLKFGWLILAGGEWRWRPIDFTLFDEDNRTEREKKEQFNEALNEIPSDIKRNYVLMLVAIFFGVFLLLLFS